MKKVSPILNQHGGRMASALFYQTGGGRERRYISTAAQDSSRTQTPSTRSQIMGLARYLTANCGAARGAVQDMARYSVGGGILPQSLAGESAREYERYFADWSKVCDAAGRMSFGQMQFVASLRIDTDGDVGFLMTSSREGAPRLQMIEGHRIGQNNAAGIAVADESFFDGVQTDGVGMPLAFQIHDGAKTRRVPARDFILLHEIDRADAVRGLSGLAHALNNLRDASDILEYEKVGVKQSAAIGLAITTGDGSADSGNSFIEEGFEAADTGQLPFDTFQSGMVPRLKTGESIQSFQSNRPNSAFAGFLDFLMRDVACGLGLPVEFIWNSEKLGGATQRFCIAKAQRRFEQRQQLLESRLLERVWAWVISRGIQDGDLPKSKDWHRVRWQPPARVIVDVGREATANRDDVKMGMRSLAEDAGERGIDWQDLREQTEREAVDLIERAERIAAAKGITLEFALNLLQSRSPNPPTLAATVTET